MVNLNFHTYWRLIHIECLRYWLLHVLALGPVMQAKGEDALGQQFGWIMRLRTESRSQNTPCMSISHRILRIIRIPCPGVNLSAWAEPYRHMARSSRHGGKVSARV